MGIYPVSRTAMAMEHEIQQAFASVRQDGPEMLVSLHNKSIFQAIVILLEMQALLHSAGQPSLSRVHFHMY